LDTGMGFKPTAEDKKPAAAAGKGSSPSSPSGGRGQQATASGQKATGTASGEKSSSSPAPKAKTVQKQRKIIHSQSKMARKIIDNKQSQPGYGLVKDQRAVITHSSDESESEDD